MMCLIYLFTCTCIGVLACLYVCAPCGAEARGVSVPGIRVMYSCELPSGWQELNQDPLRSNISAVHHCSFLRLPISVVFQTKATISMVADCLLVFNF